MDWDGVGTFAMFLASGAVGVSIAMLKAYKAKLAANLERERIRAHSGEDAAEVLDKLATLESQMGRLSDRVDFTERLLGSGSEVEVQKNE